MQISTGQVELQNSMFSNKPYQEKKDDVSNSNNEEAATSSGEESSVKFRGEVAADFDVFSIVIFGANNKLNS